MAKKYKCNHGECEAICINCLRNQIREYPEITKNELQLMEKEKQTKQGNNVKHFQKKN